MRDARAVGTTVAFATKAELAPFTDPYYPGFDERLPDYWRFKEWEHEFDDYVRNGNLPALELMRLGGDHFGDFARAIDGVNTVETQMAANDYALGLVIEKVAHSPYKNDTLVFVVEDDAQDGPDHVEAHRTLAFVAGAYVRQRALVSERYTSVHVLRTIEDILGIEPLGLNDSSAEPMTAVFDREAQAWDYQAVVPVVLRTTKLPLPEATAVTHSKKEDAEALPAETPEAEKIIRLAVVGRPNTGKSTLINRLLGEERLLTGPEPGITRDAIAVDVQWRGQRLRIHDTAGLRRRPRITEKLEKLSVADTLNAVRFAEVVIVLIDAQTPFEEQDTRIADLVEREGRALVIGINKWDLVKPPPGAFKRLRDETDRILPQVKGVPVVAFSARTGAGLDRLMVAVLESYAVWNRRVPTAKLNRFLAHATAEHAPPAAHGRRPGLDYMTQAKARPPTFVLFCSRAAALPETYRRYLVNELREQFDLPGTPIRLTVRGKPNPYAGRKRRR